MKAIILAAGYATRLRPLTDDVPKPLLPVGGRPILDWILANIRQVDEIDQISRRHEQPLCRPVFEAWGAANGVVVHDDGTSTNEDRLGAIGDLKYVLDRGRASTTTCSSSPATTSSSSGSRLRALLGHPSRHQRGRRLRLRRSRARRRVRNRRAGRRGPDHLLRRETCGAAVDPRRDRHLLSTRGVSCR